MAEMALLFAVHPPQCHCMKLPGLIMVMLDIAIVGEPPLVTWKWTRTESFSRTSLFSRKTAKLGFSSLAAAFRGDNTQRCRARTHIKPPIAVTVLPPASFICRCPAQLRIAYVLCVQAKEPSRERVIIATAATPGHLPR